MLINIMFKEKHHKTKSLGMQFSGKATDRGKGDAQDILGDGTDQIRLHVSLMPCK